MAYDTNNIFAKILRGEIPNNTVYEDEAVLAFHDISPAAPVHVIVIPKGEYQSFNDFAVNAGMGIVAGFFAKVQHIANELGVADSGYRLITNHGADASQTVPHFHVHILAGAPLGGLVASDVLTR
jgi:diadenosine tetraphosphate (Ap4A) HIT family hydrolase